MVVMWDMHFWLKNGRGGGGGGGGGIGKVLQDSGACFQDSVPANNVVDMERASI